MPFKLFLAAVIAAGATYFAAALWTPASAMGPVGPSATSSAKSTLIQDVRHRRWRRGYAYYPRHRWYGYRYRPYYSYYGAPYYARPYYYRSYDYPYYYGPRVYGYGFYGPRFGLRIGF